MALGVWHLVSCLPGILACLGGHWQGPGHPSCLASPFFPIPIPLLAHSLDLSELAKAAKKKLQAVSLLRPRILGAAPILNPLPAPHTAPPYSDMVLFSSLGSALTAFSSVFSFGFTPLSFTLALPFKGPQGPGSISA